MSLARDAAEPDALSSASMALELTGRVEDADMRQTSTERYFAEWLIPKKEFRDM